jgi:hypothetical protein
MRLRSVRGSGRSWCWTTSTGAGFKDEIYGAIFADGFESADTVAWSAAVP